MAPPRQHPAAERAASKIVFTRPASLASFAASGGWSDAELRQVSTLCLFLITHRIHVFVAASSPQRMSDTAFRVMRQGGTEPRAVRREVGGFDDHFSDGIYSCACCGHPLYDSKHKFDCKCGWPGFWDCLAEAVLGVPDKDGSRTEIKCARCNSHLGELCLCLHRTLLTTMRLVLAPTAQGTLMLARRSKIHHQTSGSASTAARSCSHRVPPS